MGRQSPGEIGRDQAIRTVAEIIGRIRIAMLTTLTGDGAFRSRPITTHGARFDGDLWFLTRMGSAKIEEVRQHRRVGLTYARSEDNSYVALTGTAEVVVDVIGLSDVFTGPFGPTYTINDGEATYNAIPTGQTKSCLDEADCFSVTVSAAIPRPAPRVAPATTAIRSWSELMEATVPRGGSGWACRQGCARSRRPCSRCEREIRR